jgi:hypothetical protein
MTVVNRHPDRAGGLLLRTARLFLHRNVLRRRSERVEAAVVAGLLAAFVAATVVAGFIAARVFHSEQVQAAGLRPAIAVLSAHSAPTEAQLLNQTAAVPAIWRLADGAERSGLLTTAIVPGVFRHPPGASIQVWVNPSGEAEAPPQGVDGMIVGATMAGLAAMVAAGAVLSCAYLLCRAGLDRHRLASWSSAWAVTGPQWTHRR